MKIVIFNNSINVCVEIDLPAMPQLNHKVDVHSLFDVKTASKIPEDALHEMLAKKWFISGIEWKRLGAEWVPYLEFTQCGLTIESSDSKISVLEKIATELEVESAKYKTSDELKEKRMLEAVKSLRVAVHNLVS